MLTNVDRESAPGVDLFVECVKVSVDLCLGDCRLVVHDLVIDF